MTSHSGADGSLPAAQVETFSSANAVVVGVLLDLLAAGSRRAASAWVHAHTAFVEGERSDPQRPCVTRLIVWPYGQEDERSLRGVLPALEESLARRIGYLSGYKGSEHRTPLLLELRDGTQHPGPTRHQQLQQALDLAYGEAEPATRQALGKLREALDRARIGVAGSTSCGGYDVLHVADCDDQERDSLQALIQPVADALHAHQKSARRRGLPLDGAFLNNFSPVTADVTPDPTLSAAPTASAAPVEQRSAPLTIGVITPGGTAAPRDVLGKLEHIDGIDVQTVVVPRGATGLTRKMVREADSLLLEEPAAIIAGYGGGRPEDLDPVFDALRDALGHCPLPIFIAIGHRDYRRQIDSDHVRMCATPADAAELFRIEILDLPRRRASAAAQAAAALASAVGDPVRSKEIASQLSTQLAAIDVELQAARNRHLQP